MKRIEYRVLYSEGQESIVAVFANTINSGFRKATAIALADCPKHWEISRVEFWMVTS